MSPCAADLRPCCVPVHFPGSPCEVPIGSWMMAVAVALPRRDFHDESMVIGDTAVHSSAFAIEADGIRTESETMKINL
jgi:hypothetical protein